MPSFEIPDAPTTVKLSGGGDASTPRTGSVVYTVNNTTADTMQGRVSVQVAGASQREWFTIDGSKERSFGPGNSETVTVQIRIPSDVPAGEYPFRPRAVAVNDPDNDYTDGPVTTAVVEGEPEEAGGVPWWVWLLILLGVLALAGGVGYWLLSRPGQVTDEREVSELFAVPDYKSLTLDEARALGSPFDLVGEAIDPDGNEPGTIVDQNPSPGSEVAEGSVVKVSIDPGVVVPAMQGDTLSTAINKLSQGQFAIPVVKNVCKNTSTNMNKIVAQSLAPNTRVASGTVVTLTVQTRTGKPLFFNGKQLASSCAQVIKIPQQQLQPFEFQGN